MDDTRETGDEIVNVHCETLSCCTPIIQYGIGNARKKNHKICTLRHCKDGAFGTRFAMGAFGSIPHCGGICAQRYLVYFCISHFWGVTYDPLLRGDNLEPLSRGEYPSPSCGGCCYYPQLGGFFCFPPNGGSNPQNRRVVKKK